MNYATEHIARALRKAREAKGLNQRELGKKAGVPQGHISKIENGAVDLRLSSLVALARTLDLELALAPRKVVPALKSLARSSSADALRERAAPQPLYSLDEEGDD
jgi:transcriptional regulator with XRE-family HTH domain